MRSESGLTDPAWDFMFEAIYQSTDETDDENTVDPETDSSGADVIKVSTAACNWITRPLAYRANEVGLLTSSNI